MSACKCTHNAICRAHRAVIELNIIAGDLYRAGWKHEADRISATARKLLVKLNIKAVPF